MPEPIKQTLGLIVVLGAILLIARRYDARLVLFLAALALGGLAGDVTPVIRTFLITLSSEQFVIPICTAMGFAQVLRHSGCDQHLVHLLVRPLRTARPLLIPGAVVVGFLVNMSVISQASTAVAVGTVLVPLLRTAGLTPTTIGATLLLGASLGGELLNPGAPELNTVAKATRIDARQVVPEVLPLLLVQLAAATAVFWFISARAEAREGRTAKTKNQPDLPSLKINLFKAAVPVLPLALLMIVGPPFNLIQVPEHWLVNAAETGTAAFGTRLIGASMLVGSALAALAAPRTAADSARVFFEGAGLAFTRIVSIIVIAQCLSTSIKQLNLDEPIRDLIRGYPQIVWPISGGITLAFGVLCGSGMAATQSLYDVYINSSMSLEMRLRIGAVVSIAAAAGRTMSPVSAVVFTCANLTESEPLAIIRRVAGPLLVATCVTVLTARLRGG